MIMGKNKKLLKEIKKDHSGKGFLFDINKLSKDGIDVLKEIKETVDDTNSKLDELNKLDKGSKVLSAVGIVLMAVSMASMAVITTVYEKDFIPMFIGDFIFGIVIVVGYASAHKGLTGVWL